MYDGQKWGPMINNTVFLICQTVLLAYGQPCIISAGLISLGTQVNIHANEKAVVFVDTRVAAEATVVYSLHEHAPHDVIVDVNQIHFHLAPARALFVTSTEVNDFDKIPGKLDFVQYFSPHKVGRNIWMTNFVLTTLIAAEPEFRKLLDSDDKAEQKVLDQILRTAVMLHHTNLQKPELPPGVNIGPCKP